MQAEGYCGQLSRAEVAGRGKDQKIGGQACDTAILLTPYR